MHVQMNACVLVQSVQAHAPTPCAAPTSSKGVRNGASYVASLCGGERQKQILFYTFLFFYVLLDPHVSLSDYCTT